MQGQAPEEKESEPQKVFYTKAAEEQWPAGLGCWGTLKDMDAQYRGQVVLVASSVQTTSVAARRRARRGREA